MAFVLLLAMIVLGTTSVVVIGGVAITNTQTSLDLQRAEKVMTQFDSKSAMVALGNSPVHEVDLSDGDRGSYELDPEAGWMRINSTNTSAGSTETILNVTLGAVVYEHDRTSVAYQGGGVWRTRGNGSTMVSPPEFHYRDETLTLPVITVDGRGSLGDRAVVTKNGSTVQWYPNATEDKNWTNPLKNSKVTVTVRSDYYRAWGQFFQQRTDGSVDYDHEKRLVNITLTAPAGPRNVTSGIAATSPTGSLSLSGSGPYPARTDSYTSSDGDGYDPLENDVDDNITLAGDMTVSGNSCVAGSIRAGGTVSLSGSDCPSGSYKVKGDARYGTNPAPDSGDVNGDIDPLDDIDGEQPVNVLINNKVNEIEDSPDSDGDISGDELSFGGDSTLPAGEYYLEKMEVEDGESLVLDTSGGEVVVAVEQYAKIHGSVAVTGNERARIYVKGQGTVSCTGPGAGNCHFWMDDGSQMTTPDQNATRLWVYGKGDMNTKLRGPGTFARFEGVVYAPGGGTGSGEIYVEKAEIFGALVAPDVSVNQGGELHYDRSLGDVRAVPRDENIIPVTFLHISHNRVNVTSA